MAKILKCYSCNNNVKINYYYGKCNCGLEYFSNENKEICAIQYKKINIELTLSLESNNGKSLAIDQLTLYVFPYINENYCIIKENLNFASAKDLVEFIFIEYDKIVNNLLFL